MKLTQIDKLYRKFTPTELGTMAFDAMERKDEGRADLILGNVGWETYLTMLILNWLGNMLFLFLAF